MALKAAGETKADVSPSIAVLRDMRQVFQEKKVDRIRSAHLVVELNMNEDMPWREFNRTIRFGPNLEDMAKGYCVSVFEDAFARYPKAAKCRRRPPPW